MDKILTITVPAYNVEMYLDSILPTFLDDQILDVIEIFIVNDGSKDKTKEIGQRYVDQYPGIVYLIDKENGGHGSTINKGIELATGKYFKVVDGDDWVDTKEFVKFVKILGKLEMDVVATPYVRVNETTKEREIKTFLNVEFEKTYEVDDVLNDMGEQYAMHALTFKTKILKKIPKISEHCFYVDMEYIIYPLKYIKTITFLNILVYQYRVGNSEQSVSIKNKQKNREMHKRVIKNLIEYFLNEELSSGKHTFLSNRVRRLISEQIRIYLSFNPSSEIKKELTDFCSLLSERVPDLYAHIPGKLCRILYISNNRLYGLLSLYHSRRCK